MKIIVPMAGMGKRMRPHTLTIPKPLLPIAGKPIVQHLVEDITNACKEKVDEIAFIIGNFGKETENQLLKIANNLGAAGTIYYQNEPLGTAHAILCAEKSLEGKLVVAFADTLFRADFTIDEAQDGIIWVKKIEDPRQFGVVKVNTDNIITDFIEKPQTFVSDLAIIGIYYIKDGAYLKKELQYLIDNNIKDKGEYQLTNALENMKNKGSKFMPGNVLEWLDCGNKNSTVYTNQRVLEFNKDKLNINNSKLIKNNAIIISPCYVGEKVEVINSIIGPYVSIGDNSKIINSVIQNSIIQNNSKVKNAVIENSMLGNFVEYSGSKEELSIGDYSVKEVLKNS